MLAVKLHRQKKPWLGKGSYLIPIASWETGRIQILNWIKILNDSAKRSRYAKFRPPIKFITLVKIPDDYPVALHKDWAESWLRKEWCVGFEFEPLEKVYPEIKRELKEWYDHYFPMFAEGPMHSTPELIIGKDLPKSCVKWTKDIRLLYRGDKRKTK